MSHKIFGNSLIAIQKSKVSSKINKAVYIGMCILELTKASVYEFHYDYMKNKYDHKSKLLFTDTDSLMYGNKTEDIYEDFSINKEMFDFSNYLVKSKYYDNSKKLLLEKIKLEKSWLRNLLDWSQRCIRFC